MLKCNLFLWSKAEFSASLLQSSVSRDPSEIYNQCWKQLSCLMFSGPMWSFFHYSLINKKVTKKCLFKLEMLCYIIDYYSKVWGQQFLFFYKLILLLCKDVLNGLNSYTFLFLFCFISIAILNKFCYFIFLFIKESKKKVSQVPQKNCNKISQYYFLLYFWSNKYSPD